MKIFLISNNIPSKYHSSSGAVSTGQYHMIAEFIRHGHSVILQNIFQMDDRRLLTDDEVASCDDLKGLKVEIMPVLFRSDYAKPSSRNLTSLAYRAYLRFFQLLERFYPAMHLRSIIAQRMRESSADIVFIFWNPEGVAATYKNHRVPKFVYYGMPDHVPGLARLEDSELFSMKLGVAGLAARKHDLHTLEKHHLRLMMDCNVVTNLCAEYADYYTRKGHPRSLYIQNMWPETPTALSMSHALVCKGAKPKIFGSLGTLHATGNTFGLKFIGEQIVPRLNAALGPDGYEIHIFGKGELRPRLRDLLQAPSIKMRGWVKDIDAEICSSQVFLVANNTGPYRGSHTRFLHAWSLKACCVAHSYNAYANPEMAHMENILLGEAPDEIVGLILQAIRDPGLRQRIGEGGWCTFKAHFTPGVVVGRLLNEMESLVTRKVVG